MKQIDEVEVLNVLKRYIDKKIDRERAIILPALLFAATTWSNLAHSWLGLNYMCKAKYKTLGKWTNTL